MRKAGEGAVFKHQPCFRLDLTQCTFFRTSRCPGATKKLKTELTPWLESALWIKPPRKEFSWISTTDILLDVGFGGKWNEPSPSLAVPCRHFSPQPDDIVKRKWGPRPDQVITVPTYCASDISVVQSRMQEVISEYSKFMLMKAHPLGLATSDFSELVYRTLIIASRRSVSVSDAIRGSADMT